MQGVEVQVVPAAGAVHLEMVLEPGTVVSGGQGALNLVLEVLGSYEKTG